jgi:hypothetical protein
MHFNVALPPPPQMLINAKSTSATHPHMLINIKRRYAAGFFISVPASEVKKSLHIWE